MLRKSIYIIFFMLIPFSLQAEMSLWYRILFSDKAYEKNLQVKTYILRSDQVAYLLNNPNEEPEQLIGSEIATATNYLVVRVKNMGEKHAWGTLACTVPAVWDPINVPIVSIGDEFCNYIISLDKIAVLFSHDTFAPKVTFKWYQLYTK